MRGDTVGTPKVFFRSGIRDADDQPGAGRQVTGKKFTDEITNDWGRASVHWT